MRALLAWTVTILQSQPHLVKDDQVGVGVEAEEVLREGGQPAVSEEEDGEVGQTRGVSDKMIYRELRICKLKGLPMSRYVQ